MVKSLLSRLSRLFYSNSVSFIRSESDRPHIARKSPNVEYYGYDFFVCHPHCMCVCRIINAKKIIQKTNRIYNNSFDVLAALSLHLYCYRESSFNAPCNPFVYRNYSSIRFEPPPFLAYWLRVWFSRVYEQKMVIATPKWNQGYIQACYSIEAATAAHEHNRFGVGLPGGHLNGVL